MNSLLNTVILAGAFLALFASAEWLYHAKGIRAEITRKYVHVVTGLLTMLFPVLISNHWLVLSLCGSFLVLLSASLYFNLLPSINAVRRTSRGSVLYPIVVYGCYMAYDKSGEMIYFYLPVLILALCDPLAALVGKRLPYGQYQTFGKHKTLSGSLAFLVVALILSFSMFFNLNDLSIGNAFIAALSIAAATTVAEAISHKGYDNLTIPASALLIIFLFKKLGFPL